MSNQDQSLDLAGFRARLEGQKLWRSIDELSEDENFREYLFEEFPRQATPMDEEGFDRRSFMKLMSASFALAGLAGCTPPVERIIPYVNQPEELIPGIPLYFATAMPISGVATGLLVESHEGHPTKIEGNPDHPASLGASSIFHQASVLGLYDPDRSNSVRRLGEVSTWAGFITELQKRLSAGAGSTGEGLRILTQTVTSPSLGEGIRNLQAKFPQARWHQYEPAGADSRREGARLAFGTYADTVYHLEKSEVILSLGGDFLASGPGHLRYARDFASRRRLSDGSKTMNRLYVAEPSLSSTGSVADHHLPVRGVDMEDFARAIASELGAGSADKSAVATAHGPWIRAAAADLAKHRGSSVVIAGEHQPPAVHALAHVMNQLLGNVGRTVTHIEPIEVEPTNQLESLRSLVADMNAGRVKTLIILGGNPVFDAPADFGFGAALEKVPFRVHHGLYYDETALRCHWHVPEAHYLESWGDARSWDGTVSIIQPLIAPLFEGRSAWELIDAIAGASRSGHEIVQDYWKRSHPSPAFERDWKLMLRTGVVPGTSLAAKAVSAQVPSPSPRSRTDGMEVNFRPDPTIGDGRWANNAWLQELPKAMTRLTWDNVALVSPATASRLGLANEDEVEISLDRRKVVAPVWISPGHADDSLTVYFGYGRARAGRVGTNVGFNAYAIRPSTAMWNGSGVEILKNGRKYRLATTQRHHSMEGRDPVRHATLSEYLRNPEFALEEADLPGEKPNLYPEFEYNEQRWAMVIDTSVCTGCSGCIVACQAENNIAVVGKEQVIRERAMHWLRIDRYYAGDPGNPVVYHQPVPCMHCEKAPCEPVCPVEATTHSEDGINEMTYNRCIGTRYCSNNCPYKVRRFNFLQYSDYETESLKFQRNPDVTVRSRGVMEKCTYCVQRVREARKRAEREDRSIRDGEVLTACQSACPTQAIVFGDLNDAGSRVRMLKQLPLNYAMLAELNTQPRTTYLATVRNPNPEITTERA